MRRNLQTVEAFAAAGPFTVNQIRWWIFQAEQNGLADLNAVVRIGRRVYLDVDKFERWIDQQNQRKAKAA